MDKIKDVMSERLTEKGTVAAKPLCTNFGHELQHNFMAFSMQNSMVLRQRENIFLPRLK